MHKPWLAPLLHFLLAAARRSQGLGVDMGVARAVGASNGDWIHGDRHRLPTNSVAGNH